MTRPSPEVLLSEAAQLAFFYHWPLDTILDLEHGDRRRFLREAEGIVGEAYTEEGVAYPGPAEGYESYTEE
jgi:hypothetical protein